MSKHKVIDLFCGAGGLSYGFHKAGFETIFGVEFNPVYAKTYKSNFPKTNIYVGYIKNLNDEEVKLLSKENDVDVIIGGPPCQGFSIAGNIGRRFIDDPRNELFKEFFRFVKNIMPKIFVIENVAALVRHNKGKTISEIIEIFEKLGYKVEYKILNAVNYEVPQERRRVFIVGTKNNINFSYSKELKNKISIKDAIDNLPYLESGQSSKIDLHNAMRHTKQMLEKMKYVKDGGNRNDIPAEIRPKSGDVRKYIRYSSNEPSVCVTGDMRKIFHYSQNRALTPRELARLQTFPDSYKFVGSSIAIQQQIGNAVPCNLAYYVALKCKEALEHEQVPNSKLHRQ
ncbi:DNA cytosine methyltransferase [Mycoplasmopsis caviae]|uniref:Cytosine-specific methyltransferase n=1 Tax=Mycoplasmopsis caviae TaxID=55603 RepID=A0A3P8MEN3_9BACT|nr:DNA cytosine methyltransferase [Mycoplasmopsis caviae]UUD35169.1 DNA cytosine methyltransferase [Mycoplasmopsis caviae]VDR42026.1 cytosine-specific methyltransferase [Mycoplasmopsis caviae]